MLFKTGGCMSHDHHLRRLFGRALVCLLAVWPLLLPAPPLRAEAPDPMPRVLIEEVAWAGSSIGISDEWLELANIGNATATIGGWSIRGAGDHAVFLPNDATIPPHATFVIANYTETDEHSSLTVHVQLATTTIRLSNDALKLELADAHGTVVDVAGNGDAPIAGSVSPKATMIRAMPTDGSDLLSWDTATSSTGLKNSVTDFAMPGTCSLCAQMIEMPSATTEYATDPENDIADEYENDPDKTPENTGDIDPNAPHMASSTVFETDATDTSSPVASTTVVMTDDAPIEPTHQPTTNAAQTPLRMPLIFRLNEIVSNPADGPEWVELRTDAADATSTDRALEVHDAAGRVATLLSGTPLIAPGYLVIPLPHPRLNNGGDHVTLREPNGIVLDAVTVPVLDDGVAWAKTDVGSWIETDLLTPGMHNQFPIPVITPSATIITNPAPASDPIPNTAVATTTASPAAQNPAETTIALPSGAPLHMALNEVMSNPAAGKEWVELWISKTEATTTDRALELWDASGRIANIPRETAIPAPGLLLITLSSARLNNSGDALSLREAGGNIVLDATDIPALNKGISWARSDAGWTDAAPTPGAQNPTDGATDESLPPDDPGTAASDVMTNSTSLIDPTRTPSNMPSTPTPGTRVRLVGTVGSVPRLLGATHAFILLGEDGRAAITYLPKFLNTPGFGSTVRVMGTLAATERQLELRMKTSDIWMTIATSTPPKPRDTDFLAPGVEDAWALVTTTGTVKRVATKSLVLDADGVDVAVNIPTVAGYRSKRLVPGDVVSVTGLFDPRKEDATILIRVSEDISLVEHAPESIAAPSDEAKGKAGGGTRDWLPFGAAAAAAGATGALQRVRGFLKRRRLTTLAETSR